MGEVCNIRESGVYGPGVFNYGFCAWEEHYTIGLMSERWVSDIVGVCMSGKRRMIQREHTARKGVVLRCEWEGARVAGMWVWRVGACNQGSFGDGMYHISVCVWRKG